MNSNSYINIIYVYAYVYVQTCIYVYMYNVLMKIRGHEFAGGYVEAQRIPCKTKREGGFF